MDLSTASLRFDNQILRIVAKLQFEFCCSIIKLFNQTAKLLELRKPSAMSTDEIKEQLSATHLYDISSRADEASHNHSTLALHQASENGDLAEVRNILAEGTADLDALIAGHRALRTALHKASAYGHTNVVQLLLKVTS